ncbi:MAG: CAP domain-containing protein [Deltaproteobacteria bacterium]|nr:CAP domain-containing protein [Deltaproteobacteria bacterium]
MRRVGMLLLVSAAMTACAAKAAPNFLNVNEADFDRRVVEEANAYRAGKGLGALQYSDRLHDIAQKHADGMRREQKLTHAGFQQRFADSGARTCVENLAAGSITAEKTVRGWIDSPGHNKNLLNPKTTYAAVAHAGPYIVYFACGF